jgi:hypothetical protein
MELNREDDEDGITQGMREEAQRLSATLAEQAVRTSQQAALMFSAFEMAIEREQEVWKKPPEGTAPERVAVYACVHEALGAVRSAINVILEEDNGRG